MEALFKANGDRRRDSYCPLPAVMSLNRRDEKKKNETKSNMAEMRSFQQGFSLLCFFEDMKQRCDEKG